MIDLDRDTLAGLFRQAKDSPRLRSHRLLHGGHDDQVQRLVIALRTGSYVRAHVHSGQWEMLTLLRGRLDVLLFTPAGKLTGRVALAADRTNVLQIPPGQVHGAVVVQDETAVMEVKPGPYRVNEFMDWAPAEGDADIGRFIEWALNAAAGDAWTR